MPQTGVGHACTELPQVIIMFRNVFLDRTLDNDLYTSNGNSSDLVNNESIDDNTANVLIVLDAK